MLKHEEWLWHALQDLRAAQIIFKSPEPVIGPILFHSQQCAEKSLKCFLVYSNKKLQKTHDLILLVETCSVIDPEFEVLLKSATELNPYLSGSRYPDTHYIIQDLSIAESGIVEATFMFEFVKKKSFL